MLGRRFTGYRPLPSSVLRLVVLCAVLAGLAAATPKIAPDLVASLFRTETASPKPVVEVPSQQPRHQVTGRRVAIDADPRGHFLVDAKVNGRSVEAVVDTGATTVALTAETARRLGIRLSASDYRAPISTANGVVSAAPVILAEIRLGSITVRDVTAMVVPGNALEVNLLGMSFLSRLTRFESSGGRMVLTE